jgi:hypothetical protein
LDFIDVRKILDQLKDYQLSKYVSAAGSEVRTESSRQKNLNWTL